MNYQYQKTLIAIIAIGVAAMIICIGYNYSHNSDSGLSDDDTTFWKPTEGQSAAQTVLKQTYPHPIQTRY